MISKEKLRNIFLMQDELNKQINPNWKQQISSFDYYIAFRQEMSELIDCYPWKWWKKMSENNFNKKIEYVDMFHFAVSVGLILFDKYEKIYKDEMTFDIIFDDFFQDMCDFIKPVERLDVKQEIRKWLVIDGLMKNVAMSDSNLFGKIRYEYPIFMADFLGMSKLYFQSFNEVFNLYLFKNALNKLRQQTGYKDGTYEKIINGKEDNEHYFEMLKDKEFSSVNELLEELKKGV